MYFSALLLQFNSSAEMIMKKFDNISVLPRLLFQGLYVDLSYTMVVIVVIAALFSTPLILGSIKNKVYVALKAQIEKVNNAREITIQQADANIKNALGRAFLDKLKNDSLYNKQTIVGNYQAIVMVEGPKNTDNITINSLTPNDPRKDSLQIQESLNEFGLFDVIISNSLGELLYGKDEWSKWWTDNNLPRTGMNTLSLTINSNPIKGKFRVIARQMAPGKNIYGSIALMEALKRHSQGLGAKELGLPVVEGLVQNALPRFETSDCRVFFPQNSCLPEQQANIIKELKASQYIISPVDSSKTVFDDTDQIQVSLTKTVESTVTKTKGKCEESLKHHLVACGSATLTPDISMNFNMLNSAEPIILKSITDKSSDDLSRDAYTRKNNVPIDVKTTNSSNPIILTGIAANSYDLLPGLRQMKDQHGGDMTFENEGLEDRGIEMAVPYNPKLKIGQSLSLQIGNTNIPAFVAAFYTCSKNNCPLYANAKMVFRLKNIADEMISFEQGHPPLFYPAGKYLQQIDYDNIFVYADQVEDVEALHQQLHQQFPNYSVEYNRFAINKLKQQDESFSSIFNLAKISSIIFILCAMTALTTINIDRRKRQMAQLFILGYSKLFVGVLLVLEYLLLTIIASWVALAIGWAVLTGTAYYYHSQIATMASSTMGLETIIQAMTLDLDAYVSVLSYVILTVIFVAIWAVFLASKSDPVTLLE